MFTLGGSCVRFAGLMRTGAAGGAVVGDTVIVALRVLPPWLPVIVTVAGAEVALVVTAKFAKVPPCGMVTLAGTVATAVSLLLRAMTMPPAGARAVEVTCPCT